MIAVLSSCNEITSCELLIHSYLRYYIIIEKISCTLQQSPTGQTARKQDTQTLEKQCFL